MAFLSKFLQIFIESGISHADSVARARSIRMSNFACLVGILNCFLFCIFFWQVKDYELLKITCLVEALYISTYILILKGLPNWGRLLSILIVNLAVFYYACSFRGESGLQLMLIAAAAVPFVLYSWEERRWFFLSVLPFILYVFGIYKNWILFEDHRHNYGLQLLEIISISGTMQTVIGGFYFYLRQSTKFEKESLEHLFMIEIEQKKQINLHKMSSLGEMAAGISHEINNPLMVIMGNTYKIKKETQKRLPESNNITENLEKIDVMIHRIATIIKSLKSFSRNSEHDELLAVSINSIIEGTMDLCRERFYSNNVKLEIDLVDDLIIDCRSNEISQVLLNLLNNAFDAVAGMPEPKVVIRVEAQSDHVKFSVEDNGSGIPAEIQGKIMQPFFSTKGIGKGTGLGLSISKGLVESHQGSLTYVSRPGKTIFQVSLLKTYSCTASV